MTLSFENRSEKTNEFELKTRNRIPIYPFTILILKLIQKKGKFHEYNKYTKPNMRKSHESERINKNSNYYTKIVSFETYFYMIFYTVRR